MSIPMSPSPIGINDLGLTLSYNRSVVTIDELIYRRLAERRAVIRGLQCLLSDSLNRLSRIDFATAKRSGLHFCWT